MLDQLWGKHMSEYNADTDAIHLAHAANVVHREIFNRKSCFTGIYDNQCQISARAFCSSALDHASTNQRKGEWGTKEAIPSEREINRWSSTNSGCTYGTHQESWLPGRSFLGTDFIIVPNLPFQENGDGSNKQWKLESEVPKASQACRKLLRCNARMAAGINVSVLSSL